MNESEKIIRKARIRFLYESPFFATLSMYLKIKENNSIETIGVDINGNLFYNSNFIKELNDNQVKTIIAHEVLHLALSHLSRKGTRDMKLWNIATDLAVNLIIKNEMERIRNEKGYTTFEFIDGMLLDETFTNMSAEEIYDRIYNEISKIKSSGMKEIDKHIYPKTIDEVKSSKNSIKNKSTDLNQIMTKQEIKKKENEWKERLTEAITISKQMGKLSNSLERIVDSFLDSKINWKGLLYRYITQELPCDFSYSRPHKKSYSVGYYIPHIVKETLDIVVAIDTSGSIGEQEFKEFMTELLFIYKSFMNIRITLLTCDSDIKEIYEIRNGFNFKKIKISGYGGTDFRPVFNWISKNKHQQRAKLLIYFTDGYGEYPDRETIKTLWVLPRDYNVPFGNKIILERR